MNTVALPSGPRWCVAVLLVLVLAGHLPWLAPALEDIDSVNFALGVRHFDVAAHQPHPPGYPVFIALGKLTTAAARAVMPAGGASTAVEAAGLALWGALAGALAAVPLFVFFRALDRDAWRAAIAAAVALCAPLVWFNASRPLSDLPGLASAAVALALLASAFAQQSGVARNATGAAANREVLLTSGRLIVLGALAAGLALGMRSQTAWLTLPMLALVLIDRTGREAAGALLGSAVTFTIGVLIWLVPMVWVSGGPASYVAAFSAQAGEDIAGVDLLATHFTPRRLAFAMLYSLVYPWVSTPLATVVLLAAAAGLVAVLLRARRGAVVLAAVTLPYAAFHLLFQETFTTRYAIPLVVPVAWLAVRGFAVAGRLAMAAGGLGVVAASLAIAVPAVVAYGREGGPVFRAVDEVMAALARAPGPTPVLAMHHAVGRSVRGEPIARLALASPPGREWTSLVDYWLQGGRAPAWYLVEPRRTDLALIDRHARRVRVPYRWPVDLPTLAGGARPQTIDWVEITAPGWFAADGWALTPEIAGATERDRRGPSRGGSVAWVRRRPGPAWLLVGGRNLGARGEPDVRFSLAIDGAVLHTWTASPDPGFFLHDMVLPAGRLGGDEGFARLSITAEAADGSARPVRAAVEQFDLQPTTRVVFGADQGWHEAEFAPMTGQLWRWTSERATLRVLAPPGEGVDVVLRAESPLKYFATAPTVRLLAGERVLASVTASGDLNWQVPVPADALAAAGGRLRVETSESFVPDERSGNGDRRRLGLRVYEVSARSGPGLR